MFIEYFKFILNYTIIQPYKIEYNKWIWNHWNDFNIKEKYPSLNKTTLIKYLFDDYDIDLIGLSKKII